MRKILLILFITKSSVALSQINWRTPVTIVEKNVSIYELLETLAVKSATNISYGFDNIPPETRISISVTDKPLTEVIDLICKKANLTMQVIDNVFVFRYQRPQVHATRSVRTDSVAIKKDSVFTDVEPINVMPRTDRDLSVLDTMHIKMDNTKIEGRKATTTGGVITEKSELGCFLQYAYDVNYFSFIPLEIPEQQFASGGAATFGFGTYSQLSKKLSVSVGAGWSVKSFHLNYNFKVLDLNDPIPVPHRTKVQISYLEVPVSAWLTLVKLKTYTLSTGIGINGNFRMGHSESTSYLNHPGRETRHFKDSNQRFLFGAAASLAIHRKIDKHWGMFLQTSFCQFLSKVNDTSMNSATRVLAVKAGINHTLANPK